MAGMPLRRAERSVKFPIVQKPDDWHARSIAQRLEANLGLSIDRCYDYLSVPIDQCTGHMLSAQKEVAIAHVKAGFRYMLDRANTEDRERILAEVAKRMTSAAACSSETHPYTPPNPSETAGFEPVSDTNATPSASPEPQPSSQSKA